MSHFKRSVAYAVSLLLALAGVGLAASPAQAALTFFYAAAQDTIAGSVGISAHMTAQNLTLAGSDFHTLMEVSAQSADQQQTVEVGFTIDPALNGDSLPRIFVSSWRNGVHRGYNTANPAWVDWAGTTTYNAGTALTAGTAYRFLTQYNSTDCGSAPNGWWVAVYPVGGTFEWLGCFKDTDWTSPTFTTSPFMQGFGEVAANSSTPCTNMAKNPPPAVATSTTGAQIGSLDALGVTGEDFSTYSITNSAWYNVVADSLSTPGAVRTVRVGGGGAC